jgi:hypothetical protein
VASEQVVTRQLWYERSPETPALPAEAGLDFGTSFASGAEGRTVVLHAAWALPKNVSDALSGRVTAALQIVAVDAVDGRVYSRNAERRPHGDSGPMGPSGQFHVDLSKHLGLPPQRRAYSVFLWLGERTSRLEHIELHGDEPEASVFTFSKVPESAKRPDPEIALKATSAKKGGFLEGVKLEGSARLAATRVVGKGPVFLSMLALTKSGRLRWAAQMLPEQLWQAAEVQFDLEPSRFVHHPEALAPEPLHALAVLRGVKSNVVALDAKP